MLNIKKLESDIKAGVTKYMKSEGFEDSEIPQYSKVEIEKLPDGRIKCEVRAELSYDGSFALADALDPLVAKVDPNAYFDIETPGIITAFIEGISKSGNNVIAEEKVSEYRGYSIYRVPDADKDDFEIWKNGKKIMSCETDKAAEEWIDSQEDAITETLNAILAGKPVREAIFNFKPVVSDNSLKAQDVYSNSSKFQDLLKSFVSSFKPGSEYSVQLEFAVDRSDMDSSGASITLGAIGDKVYLEVAKLLDGKLSTVRRVSATHLSDACDLFKSLVDQAESNEFDENNIVVTIISDGTEKRLEMPNPSYKLAKAANESVSINEDVESKLKAIETDDFQYRGGNYPESGLPDTIDVWKNTATFAFKNTSEDCARNWVSRFLIKKGFSVDKISSNQIGDYEDDWVEVYAEIGGLIESQHLKESRKFVKGEKFTFRDKYGSTHECTVLDKELFDEMDYDDYAIGTMTYSYPTLGNDHKETVRILKSEQGDSYGDEYFVSDRTNGNANWVFPNRK